MRDCSNVFRNEVRTARRVSHPNVCRVYDVGEVDGQTFFTMEYVDGEDLASLLRRIGRLPQDKALDIARQLCAGLAAAHAKGVLHRDMKPANIMLDGRGQVVITDFGLAGVAEQIPGTELRSGTPAYMAPEQLEGKEVSVRSDIYALGLVLYEVFTGKRAFTDKPATSLRNREERTPSRPSSVVKDLDPAIERVILRCLETEPVARPANVHNVAAALPGGDPLAAALAAGETPSPQMVAAAGEAAGLGPRVAVICLAAALVGLAIAVYLTIRSSALDRLGLEMSPEVLTQKAREMVGKLGYERHPVDSFFGLYNNGDLEDSIEKNDKPRPDWSRVLSERPSLMQYWYRQSPRYMVARDFYDLLLTPGIIQSYDPPEVMSGMVHVELDPQGRLIYLLAIPPEIRGRKGSAFRCGGLGRAVCHGRARASAISIDPASLEFSSGGRYPRGLDRRVARIETAIAHRSGIVTRETGFLLFDRRLDQAAACQVRRSNHGRKSEDSFAGAYDGLDVVGRGSPGAAKLSSGTR